MNDFQALDALERIRAWALHRRPATEAELRAVATLLPVADPAERRLRAVAGILNLVDQTAGTRRLLRRILRFVETQAAAADSHLLDCESDPEATIAAEPDGAGEPWAAWHKRLSPERQRTIRDTWAWLDGAAANRPGMSALALARGLAEAVPALRGLASFRVLDAVGYDVAVPDRAHQRVLFRLGLTPMQPGLAPKTCLEALGAFSRLADLSGERVRPVAHLLGLLAGAERGFGADARGTEADGVALCRARPDCKRCPVEKLCAYARYGGDGKSDRPDTSIKSWDENDRPRERLARLGTQSMSDAELLAIILRTGHGDATALDLARRLLQEFESLDRLDQAAPAELERVKGIGPAKAVEIKAALELGKRVFQTPLQKGRRLTGSAEVFEAMRSRLGDQKRELFVLLALNNKNEILRVITVSIGNLTQSLVHPREVFREAIREAAAAVICVHNHPSGDPEPSREDFTITSRLRRAGDVLGIRVLDHIIIGRDGYFSFADEGRMDEG